MSKREAWVFEKEGQLMFVYRDRHTASVWTLREYGYNDKTWRELMSLKRPTMSKKGPKAVVKEIFERGEEDPYLRTFLKDVFYDDDYTPDLFFDDLGSEWYKGDFFTGEGSVEVAKKIARHDGMTEKDLIEEWPYDEEDEPFSWEGWSDLIDISQNGAFDFFDGPEDMVIAKYVG